MKISVPSVVLLLAALASAATPGRMEVRRIGVAEYRDKVHAAWLGQVVGAAFGFSFEGQARNAIMLDHTLQKWNNAVVDDDYYYEMVALYGFERFGIGMSVAQLGSMWREYRAGTWGSSEQARLALERGIPAPDSGSPRYNRWFYTIGPQFSSDIYGMISPGMVNLAGATARKYSHVNGYAEGSDGAVFVAACISEAFFEKDPARIVRQAAQLIDARSNFRKAIDFVLQGYERGRPWRETAAESEARWRPDYPMLNNAVANGALVALGLLYGGGDYVKSINIVTSSGDYTDADCNAANISSVLGAMHGTAAIPKALSNQFNDRIVGDHMGPLKFGRTIDERISDLARRIAVLGEKYLFAAGARREGDTLVIPREKVAVQPLESFDINEYGSLWNPDWKLRGAGRGETTTTYLDGDVLITYPRDSRPCRLERTTLLPGGAAKLSVEVGFNRARPWRLQVFADDDEVLDRTFQATDAGTSDHDVVWSSITIDLSKYAGTSTVLRLYQWAPDPRIHGEAYWRKIQLN